MDPKEKLRLENFYKEAPDQQIIDMLLEDGSDYQEGVYALLLREAEKRGLKDKINEIKKNKEEELEEQRQREQIDEGDNLVCVFRTFSKSQIAIIKSLLEANDVLYHVDNEHFASLRGASDGAVNFGVLVPKKNAEEVKDLLKEFIAPQKPQAGAAHVVKKGNEPYSLAVKLKQNKFLKFGFIVWGIFSILFGILTSLSALHSYLSGEEFARTYLSFLLGTGLIFLGYLFIRGGVNK